MGRPDDLRHLNRRHRIRHKLGLVPAPELGTVGSDDRDNATSAGSRFAAGSCSIVLQTQGFNRVSILRA